MKKYIWEGSVGVILQGKQNRQTREWFWTYRLTRFAGEAESGEKRYSDTFSSRDNANLGQALSKAMSFMDQNDPAKFGDEVPVKGAA